MTVTVVYPPLSTALTTPPAALAALKALKRQNLGCAVVVKDLNILLLHEIFDAWPRLAPLFQRRFAERLADDALRQPDRTRLARLLYFHIPYISRLLSSSSHERTQLGETNAKVLYAILCAYFLGDLLTDDSFLFADPWALESAVADLCRDPILTSFLRRHLADGQDVLGLSLIAESQLPFALAVARVLKESGNAAAIVAGGPYISEMVKARAKLDTLLTTFDFLVAFEGESALVTVADALSRGQTPEHPNVLSRDRPFRGTIYREPLDSLRTLEFDDLDLSLYMNRDLSLPVYSSKGCPWGRCTFCSIQPTYYRERRVDLLMADVQDIKAKTNISHFQFVDEDMTPARLGAISSVLRSSAYHIRWFIQARLDKHLDYELLHLMRSAGCYALEFGLESGSPAVLRRIRKGIRLETVRRILHACEQLEYRVILNCMVGFPDETFEEARETARFIDELIDGFPRLQLSCNTQLVKIYKTGTYAQRSDLGTRPNSFSTIMNWNRPPWLDDFISEYRSHRLFSGPHVPNTYDESSSAARPSSMDPQISLHPSWQYCTNIPFEFVHSSVIMPGQPYLLNWSGRGRPDVHTVNSSMALLLGELATRRMRLSELRRAYAAACSEFPVEEVTPIFNSAILHLNSMGMLDFS